MRLGIAQTNPTLGAFEKNSNKILEYIEKAKAKKCDLVVFPESSLFGYHPFDLLELESLIDQQSLFLKKICKDMPEGVSALIGLFTKNNNKKGRPYFNSAALIEKGKTPKYFHKELLPTGDVFDEARFIEKGDLRKNFFKFKGHKFFLTICEDIWAWPDEDGRSVYLENPIKKIKAKDVDLVINMSASPYYPDKIKIRKNLVAKTAKHFKAPMIYCNLVGAQDEIVFDGASFVLNKKGDLVTSLASFEEDLNVFDLESLKGGFRPSHESKVEELRRALVLGIRDFCEKTNLKKVHLGLSGGIDSAVVACLAVDALGPANVAGIAMPGPFSASKSLSLAEQLAKNLNIHFQTISIESSFQSIRQIVDQAFGIQDFSVVHENLQARLRGLILMAFANKENSLLLSTGNKSEYATGYCTLYGDMNGGLVPLGDLLKKEVYNLAKLYNSQRELIPKDIIERAPSAELRPNQKDQDSLPEYDLLDKSVNRIVTEVSAAGSKTDQWLLSVLLKTEFKRWQAPPILKVSKHSFGRGRRYPITHQAKIKN